MMYSKYDVYKIIEYRNDSIYKTELVGTVWFSPNDSMEKRKAMLKEIGGDTCVSTTDVLFQKERP